MKYMDKQHSEASTEASQKESSSSQVNGLPDGFNPSQTPEAIVKFDSDRKHTYYSENLISLLQVQTDKIIGKTLVDTGYLKEISEEVDRMLELTLISGQHFYKEYSFFLESRLFWVSVSFIPEKNVKDETIAVTGLLRDISASRNFEHKYKEKKQRYQLAASASDLGIWDWIAGSEDFHLSRKWKMQLGYFPDELEDKFSTWMDLLHPDDYNRVKRSFENFLKDSSLIYETEFRMHHKDGTYHWFQSRVAAIRDAEDNAVRILGTNRDITSEKKSQSDLHILHQAIMQSSAPIVITDLDGYIELFNPAFCKITGYSKEELVGKKTNVQKSGFHPQSFYKQLWSTITSGNQWVGELKNRKKSGHVYWELATISSLKNEHGVITNYLKISEDISSIKKLKEELKRSKKRTQIESQSRTSFMANMSHEIRTPINGIIGFSELLKSGGLTAEQQIHYADIIEESSRYLLSLIDDIIDISKIEAGDLKLKKDACSLKNTFSELHEQFISMRNYKKKENLDIRFRKPRLQHHDYIFTDTRRLKQVLTNLFDNALKYTEEGHIEIGYQLLSNKKLQFYVEDTGSGIPKKYLPTIFNRIVHHAHSLKDKEGGAGLGLAISQGLVKLMGGTINVKSTMDKGSIFYFTVSYDKISSPPQQQKSKPRSSYDFSGSTILIAEDVSYNFEYLKEILRDTKANILWAKDGIDVLNLYEKNQVDLILMDIQMPEIDGYEATRTIRKTNLDIPIIAQTAYAMNDEHQQCLEAGCNEVLTKPLKMREMLEAISRHIK